MRASALVASLVLAIPGLRLLARRAWCAKQRLRLHARTPRVVWVRDADKMLWAVWGAEHDFFELEWANHLPYLRATATAR